MRAHRSAYGRQGAEPRGIGRVLPVARSRGLLRPEFGRCSTAYSDTALRRVWSSARISWYLTNLLHRFPEASDFDQRAQEFELEHLKASHHAQVALAEQYAGLPFELAT